MFKPLGTYTISTNSSDITIDNIFDTTYSTYQIIADNIIANSAESTITMQLINSGGTLDETEYEWHGYRFDSTQASTATINSTSDTKFDEITKAGTTDEAGGFYMFVYNPGQSGKTFVQYRGVYAKNAAAQSVDIKGMQNTAEAHRGVKFSFSSNLDSGNISIYGVG
jgi:hypothetical protein